MPVLKIILSSCRLPALLAWAVLFLSAQAPVKREYQVKATFIFNFTRFVEWPGAAFSSEQAPFIIGVYGQNPFGSFLEETVAGEKAGGHLLLIRYCNNTEDIKDCHILFIHQAEAAKIPPVLAGLKGHQTLTVSDGGNFMQEGGMIRFFTKENKIQLQINVEAAKSANLNISSKLLRLAEIYNPH